MPPENARRLGELLRRRNLIDAEIAALINRPMAAGHPGEWIAAQVFDLQLEPSATATAIDGRFRSGPLAGRSVNVKWYLKREGILDMTTSEVLDYYLVMTGPSASAASSRGGVRPWCIHNVYLFDARELLEVQRARGVKIGIASSVPKALWAAAEIFPVATNVQLSMTGEQRAALEVFRLDAP
ncbi:hypothetical protein [Jiangella mangrovi]|uniref:Uncharacterized protein n=1 Tax=Jiangella mangrovi TaxID=1524084 RepID=A0A7W9GM84_9ACTN|nr:hypothetical protein [Jiangella mangrovi]MBB5786375.1 hypothetical protein [Jiangella mangrovi]